MLISTREVETSRTLEIDSQQVSLSLAYPESIRPVTDTVSKIKVGSS